MRSYCSFERKMSSYEETIKSYVVNNFYRPIPFVLTPVTDKMTSVSLKEAGNIMECKLYIRMNPCRVILCAVRSQSVFP